MTISRKVWQRYIDGLRKVNDEAVRLAWRYLETHDVLTQEGTNALIEYCYGLATKYGEAAAELACEMYDALAAATGATVAPAIPAATATMQETAKAVVGTLKTGNNEIVSSAVGRIVKMAGVDTTMQNALRDGAEWAWIPVGDTCAFASRLRQEAGRGHLKRLSRAVTLNTSTRTAIAHTPSALITARSRAMIRESMKNSITARTARNRKTASIPCGVNFTHATKKSSTNKSATLMPNGKSATLPQRKK